MQHMRECLESILNQRMQELAWRQAKLKVSHGGVGMLDQAQIAACAYLGCICMCMRTMIQRQHTCRA